MNRTRKILVLVLAVALISVISVSATLAWLSDSTPAITNTFTVGDIKIELKETWNADKDPQIDGLDAWEGKIVPGGEATKDPKVTVKAGSEDCWLFVKITETNNTIAGTSSKYAAWTIADGWTAVTGAAGVYARKVTGITADQEFNVLANNKVTYSQDITKAQLEAIGQNKPEITVQAYAIQLSAAPDDAAVAWAEVNK